MDNVLVIGASLAGLRSCETLRSQGFAGTITLVGDDPHLPYDRPPLSKKLLAGEWDAERIALRKPDALEQLGLDLRLGVAAVSLDASARAVALDDASEVRYDGLVIATGAAPRPLPGQPQAEGIHVLRTLSDSLALRDELQPGTKVVVIGAGFIGLEVAATARGRGCEVVVLEAASAPMIRGLGADMGTAVAAVHARNGVDVRCGVHVGGLLTQGGRVVGVQVGEQDVPSSVVPAEVVVVGIGVVPCTDWLVGSGLDVGNGVICDEHLWAGAPGVYAAGDCARWTNRLFGDEGEQMRVEHWTNAAEQGAAAAANLLAWAAGTPQTAYAAVPFFWSDQFDSRIQFVGRAADAHDEVVEVVSGSTDGAFVALYGHRGRLRGVLGVNSPRQVMPYRKLLADRCSWDEALDHARTVPSVMHKS